MIVRSWKGSYWGIAVDNTNKDYTEGSVSRYCTKALVLLLLVFWLDPVLTIIWFGSNQDHSLDDTKNSNHSSSWSRNTEDGTFLLFVPGITTSHSQTRFEDSQTRTRREKRVSSWESEENEAKLVHNPQD